jgi:hypothetical protein
LAAVLAPIIIRLLFVSPFPSRRDRGDFSGKQSPG